MCILAIIQESQLTFHFIYFATYSFGVPCIISLNDYRMIISDILRLISNCKSHYFMIYEDKIIFKMHLVVVDLRPYIANIKYSRGNCRVTLRYE